MRHRKKQLASHISHRSKLNIILIILQILILTACETNYIHDNLHVKTRELHYISKLITLQATPRHSPGPRSAQYPCPNTRQWPGETRNERSQQFPKSLEDVIALLWEKNIRLKTIIANIRRHCFLLKYLQTLDILIVFPKFQSQQVYHVPMIPG